MGVIVMKAFIILTVFATLGIIFFQYSRNKDLKKLFIALITFAVIIALSVVGNVTRPVMPIFLAHMMLIIASWVGLVLYLVRERYYWWLIFSPVVTIVLFLLLETVAGSGSHLG